MFLVSGVFGRLRFVSHAWSPPQVDMLTKLKDKFEDERAALEKEEMTAKQSYEMMMQDLTDQAPRPGFEGSF